MDAEVSDGDAAALMAMRRGKMDDSATRMAITVPQPPTEVIRRMLPMMSFTR
jgi:hypothetical protein